MNNIWCLIQGESRLHSHWHSLWGSSCVSMFWLLMSTSCPNPHPPLPYGGFQSEWNGCQSLPTARQIQNFLLSHCSLCDSAMVIKVASNAPEPLGQPPRRLGRSDVTHGFFFLWFWRGGELLWILPTSVLEFLKVFFPIFDCHNQKIFDIHGSTSIWREVFNHF